MKALYRIGNLLIESIQTDLELIILDENNVAVACLNPQETRDLLNLLKTHITELIEQKMCRVCENFYKSEICGNCNNKEKFTPIEY